MYYLCIVCIYLFILLHPRGTFLLLLKFKSVLIYFHNTEIRNWKKEKYFCIFGMKLGNLLFTYFKDLGKDYSNRNKYLVQFTVISYLLYAPANKICEYIEINLSVCLFTCLFVFSAYFVSTTPPKVFIGCSRNLIRRSGIICTNTNGRIKVFTSTRGPIAKEWFLFYLYFLQIMFPWYYFLLLEIEKRTLSIK